VDAQSSVLYYGYLIHFSHKHWSPSTKDLLLLTNLRSLPYHFNYAHLMPWVHHLLLGRYVFTKLRTGKHSADHVTILTQMITTLDWLSASLYQLNCAMCTEI
jgi:hypothetical protein